MKGSNLIWIINLCLGCLLLGAWVWVGMFPETLPTNLQAAFQKTEGRRGLPTNRNSSIIAFVGIVLVFNSIRNLKK